MQKIGSRRSARSLYILVLAVALIAGGFGILAAGCESTTGDTTSSSQGTMTTAAAGQDTTLTTAGPGGTDATATTTNGNATSGTTTPTVQADGEASPAQSVAEILGPSVVNIKVTGNTATSDPFGFGPDGQQFAAEGSGVIYRSDGMIITNNHVITDEFSGEPVSTIKVTLATGEELDATLVGRDPLTDLAVIKTKAEKELPVAQFVGTLPKVGEYAIAIGSPLGYENSVTLGVVSGLTRRIEGLTGTESAAYTNLIQTDAPISPGNSGGALANAAGQVIGINVAYEPPSMTGAVSIGFAIPASTVTNVADQLINSGHVTQGYLGVSLYPEAVSPELQEQFSLSRDSGVLVAEVVPDGPGDKAGLQQGDIIFEANGEEVTDPSTLIATVRDMRPGSQIQVKVDREGQEHTFTVTVGERPSTTPTTTAP